MGNDISEDATVQPEEELNLHSGKDMHTMIQLLVNVSIGQAAARIISMNQTEIICSRFEQLHVSTKFKQHSTFCDVLLRFYGLSAPEGSLAQKDTVGCTPPSRTIKTQLFCDCYAQLPQSLIPSFPMPLRFLFSSLVVVQQIGAQSGSSLTNDGCRFTLSGVGEEAHKYLLEGKLIFDLPNLAMQGDACGAPSASSAPTTNIVTETMMKSLSDKVDEEW